MDAIKLLDSVLKIGNKIFKSVLEKCSKNYRGIIAVAILLLAANYVLSAWLAPPLKINYETDKYIVVSGHVDFGGVRYDFDNSYLYKNETNNTRVIAVFSQIFKNYNGSQASF